MTVLSDELTNDPLSRGYSGMSDEAAAADLNTLNRPAEGDISDLRDYFILERSRTNDTGDTVTTYLYGRLKAVAAAAVGDKPFGTTLVTTWDATQRNIHACQAFLAYLDQDPQANFKTDSRFEDLLDDLIDAGVMKTPDKTAIQGFSENIQSRASELGLKRVTIGDVERARA